MKTQAFKGLFAVAAAVVLAATPLVGQSVTIGVDQIRQRYPWNGLVDIDYTVTLGQDETLGVDDNLEVLMVDKAVTPAVTNRALTFLQAPLPMTAGRHRITWDANADGVTNRTDLAEFHVKVVHYAAAYMVVDVSAGSGANVIYPVDFLNGEPDGGVEQDKYKGDKIVLRRIHPGSYMAGSPTNEANRTATREKQHRVALSQPFYIGVFEITQQQYLNVMGTNPSSHTDGTWQYRPVERVCRDQHIRGSGTTPEGSNTFIGKLIAKCRAKDSSTGEYELKVKGFDLPTEFQWEYACRAGTTNAFNTTTPFDNTDSDAQEAQLALLGRYKNNGGEQGGHAIVGSYPPNGWGLYDMHGNVVELCSDKFTEDPTALKQYKDPTGGTSGTQIVARGGSFGDVVEGCRSAKRLPQGTGDGYATRHFGFRLARTLP